MLKKIATYIFAGFLLAMLCACNYRLAGTPQPLPFRTIAVKQVENGSYAAQASAPLTNQVSKMLMASPSVELVDPDDAQAVLEIEIVDYQKQIYATRAYDTELAQVNNVVLKARATLRDVKNGTILFKDKEFDATTEILATGGSLNNEYTNMPNMTEKLARKIVDSALGIW